MPNRPSVVEPVLNAFAPAFTEPTYRRFTVLALAAILTTGRRTVSNLLRTVGTKLGGGHASSYHRLLSARRWLCLRLDRALATLILETQDPNAVIYSFSPRPWPLPVLMVLYRTPTFDTEHGRRHKTPAEWMRQLLALMIHWFPERRFAFVGDAAYGSHEFTRFVRRHRRHVKLVSRFHANANLYGPPPQRTKNTIGRPRVRGDKLPSPSEVVAKTKPKIKNVSWYGGAKRRVALVTGTGHWYHSGQGLIPIRWVQVRDLSGTRREEYFFTTDLSLSADRVVEIHVGRWSIETTFQETREYVGLGTTRGRTENTVLRSAPSLFGLYSLIVLVYTRLPEQQRVDSGIQRTGKTTVTFYDMITAVRRYLWVEWVFKTHGQSAVFRKLGSPFRRLLLAGFAPAA